LVFSSLPSGRAKLLFQAFFLAFILMRFSTLPLLLVIACAGCQTHADRDASRTYPELRKELKTVTLANGVSQQDAYIIGKCYFAKNVGCGAFEGIRDGGDHWIVDGAFGYGGTSVKGLYIDKRTGKVSQPTSPPHVGPAYVDPLKIFP
jgi:hypothetical protein